MNKREFRIWDAFQKPAFERNAFMESLIDLRATNEKAFRSLSPGLRCALDMYEKAKRAAPPEYEEVAA